MPLSPRTLRPIKKASAPPAVDPYFSNVSLLLHMNGSNGSTRFTDSGYAPKVMTATAGASISTGRSKFGVASGLFDGTGSVSGPMGSDFSFGTGDFTIEGWMYPTTLDASGASQRVLFNCGSNGVSLAVWNNAFRFAKADVANVLDATSTSVVVNQWIHYAVTRASGTLRIFINGALAGSTTYTTALDPISANVFVGSYYTSSPLKFVGSLDELRVTKGVARYTSAFTPPTAAFPDTTPTASNADAADWIDRVYANGGTVSTSTASAVNTFCNAIGTAAIRDRFYRLNLFCGTGLNACLVPLYRGPSLGGTQYGNTTDTNVGPFVSGDYVETGAGGGLLGNGTSKYLNTGLTVNDIGTAASGHLAAYHGQSSGANSNRYYMAANDSNTNNRFYLGTDAFTTATVLGIYGSLQNAPQTLASQGHGPAGHRLLSRESASSLTHYHNGGVVATNTTNITPAVSTAAFAVFAANRNGTVDRFHNSWIAAYSIGLGMTSAQAAAYYTAMQAFQTALGRNV